MREPGGLDVHLRPGEAVTTGPYREGVRVFPRAPERVNDRICRLQVPNGWIVISNPGDLLFLPDVDGQWVLEAEQPVQPTRIPQPPPSLRP